ncbi:MAG TPA: NADH-quinone oxidoreductase subunit A [Cyclobacteriaceae bacterium]|nr:NADH-quinone oxidoreductase subunit A [Cyclobacteriaceae bacterium]
MNQSYISEFGEVLLFLIGGIVFLIISLFVARLIRPNRPNPQKLATYESGEEPISTAWTQFNIRFYIVALIFILFEVELIFLFPWATVYSRKELIDETNGLWGWFSFTEMVIFILVLALGLAYAWVNGLLDWVKPEQKPSDFKSIVPKKLYDEINDRYGKL